MSFQGSKVTPSFQNFSNLLGNNLVSSLPDVSLYTTTARQQMAGWNETLRSQDWQSIQEQAKIQILKGQEWTTQQSVRASQFSQDKVEKARFLIAGEFSEPINWQDVIDKILKAGGEAAEKLEVLLQEAARLGKDVINMPEFHALILSIPEVHPVLAMILPKVKLFSLTKMKEFYQDERVAPEAYLAVLVVAFVQTSSMSVRVKAIQQFVEFMSGLGRADDAEKLIEELFLQQI